MRVYSLLEATVVEAPEGQFTQEEDGGFDLPGPLAATLLAMYVGGQKAWETGPERQARMIQEEIARRQSPEALYEAVSRLVTAAEAQAPAKASPAPPAAKAKAAAAAAGK